MDFPSKEIFIMITACIIKFVSDEAYMQKTNLYFNT